MSNEIIDVSGSADIVQFDDSKVELIRRTVAKGATNDEMELFLHQCKKMGLDPIAKQLVFTKFKNKDGTSSVAFITSIDAYRLIADRTGRYAGNDAPVFEGEETASHYKDSRPVPEKATVTVWKLVGGQRVPFSSSARWDEYYPGQHKGKMWFKMPTVMLAKCAEAAALRKAFPADLSNAYIREEMDQSSFVVADVTPKPRPRGDGGVRELLQDLDAVEYKHHGTTEASRELEAQYKAQAFADAVEDKTGIRATDDEIKELADSLTDYMNANGHAEFCERYAAASDYYNHAKHVGTVLWQDNETNALSFRNDRKADYVQVLEEHASMSDEEE